MGLSLSFASADHYQQGALTVCRSWNYRAALAIGLRGPAESAPARAALENRHQPRSEMGIFFNIGV
jgi:hypothetical protein